MTTDPFPKEHAVTVTTRHGAFLIGGIAKGSGMIEPNMATMLGFLTTDAQVAAPLLKRVLTESARDTFNAITVDGECSTNDSLFAMASGASGVVIDDDLYPALLEGFLAVSRELALGIVRGGEGATKLIAVNVRDARTIGRRAAGGANDRQLAARQDRGPRRGSQLGPDPRRRRPIRSSLRHRPRDRSRRRSAAVRERAAARRSGTSSRGAAEEDDRAD
jgi:hypothetical protein